jgi:hypothetical protein
MISYRKWDRRRGVGPPTVSAGDVVMQACRTEERKAELLTATSPVRTLARKEVSLEPDTEPDQAKA